jgi:hypothetical protein
VHWITVDAEVTCTDCVLIDGIAGSAGAGGPSAPGAPAWERDGHDGLAGARGIVATAIACSTVVGGEGGCAVEP